MVRRALGLAPGPMAVALRGYAPTPAARAAAQVIVFDTARQPAYAWSFDRGDGLSNVGYGVLSARGTAPVTKAAPDGPARRPAPRCDRRWRPTGRGTSSRCRTVAGALARGPVLLAGDAAGLVNPMTGEGIFYAVATGLAAGRAAAGALAAGDPGSAGSRQAAAVRPLLDRHLRHVRLAGTAVPLRTVIEAGLRAAVADQGVFDDLVELGLARGRITPTVAAGLVRRLTGAALRRPTPTAPPDEETACES